MVTGDKRGDEGVHSGAFTCQACAQVYIGRDITSLGLCRKCALTTLLNERFRPQRVVQVRR